VEEETVAVNVTSCPTRDGLTEDVTVVVVPDWLTVCLGDSAPLLAVNLLVPLAEPSGA
jgi:hypothetical protein